MERVSSPMFTVLGIDQKQKVSSQEELDWTDVVPPSSIFQEVQELIHKTFNFTDRLYQKLRKRTEEAKEEIKEIIADKPPKAGDELTRELIDAWDLHTRGEKQIQCRDIGYVLRILGQNPTEDEIVDMVMKANCDWEGFMDRDEFVAVAAEILKASVDQMDDVRSAFRVFDHNNDGTISKEELKDAMVNFGTRCTDEEFAAMFAEADKNQDGLIDFDEFVDMMLPSTIAGGPTTRGPSHRDI